MAPALVIRSREETRAGAATKASRGRLSPCSPKDPQIQRTRHSHRLSPRYDLKRIHENHSPSCSSALAFGALSIGSIRLGSTLEPHALLRRHSFGGRGQFLQVKIGRVEHGGFLEPSHIRNCAAAALDRDQAVGSQFHEAAIDVNVRETCRVGYFWPG
jgi:hypothetical protein